MIYSPNYANTGVDTDRGTVSVSPEKDFYKPGDVVALGNSPKQGYRYIRYEIADKSTGTSADADYVPVNGNSITMPPYDIWLRGIFYSTTPHTITLNCGEHGSAALSPEQANCRQGDEVTLTVTPESGFYIYGIEGNVDAKSQLSVLDKR